MIAASVPRPLARCAEQLWLGFAPLCCGSIGPELLVGPTLWPLAEGRIDAYPPPKLLGRRKLVVHKLDLRLPFD